MEFLVHLTDFPEWAIPMVKIIPYFNVDDAWDTSQITFSHALDIQWRKISENNYDIHVWLTADASIFIEGQGTVFLPLYTNIELVIVNELVLEELNPNKT